MVLGGAAAVAAAVPVGIAVTSWTGDAKAAAPAGLRLSAVNKTGVHADSDLTMYVVGTDPAGNQAFVRADGSLQTVSASLNGANGFADLSIPFGTTITLPKMSGRVYFAAGAKLPFKVVNGSALQFPAGWVSSDPGFGVLHDWIEFTFNDAGMFCNTTMVDMFSMPLSIQLTGKSSQTTGTPIINPGESAILAFGAIRDMPWVVDGQVVPRKVCQLALSFDHRVVDGQQGSQFLADVGALLADPSVAITY